MGVTITCGPSPGMLNLTVSPSWRPVSACTRETLPAGGAVLLVVVTVTTAAPSSHTRRHEKIIVRKGSDQEDGTKVLLITRFDFDGIGAKPCRQNISARTVDGETARGSGFGDSKG